MNGMHNFDIKNYKDIDRHIKPLKLKIMKSQTEQLKVNHPEAYKEAYIKGVFKERLRIEQVMQLNISRNEMLKKIKSGYIPTEAEAFYLRVNSQLKKAK